ncbi:hypothetical protein [Sphingobacterium lumbrici]|uniref:hypothetical protein n=1 Tax=Sphingobacterium lumbrici TaxID=2559600 RepID=UPI0011290D00|nr:hypothetical protein [Sphingobacterium lumbrici]
MKKILLLPRYFRWIGFGLVLLSILVNIHTRFSAEGFDFYFIKTFAFIMDYPMSGRVDYFSITEPYDMGLTIQLFLSLLGLACIAFTKYKVEDEMINSIRLYAWSWSIILMIAYTLAITLFVYGLVFISFYYFLPHLLIIAYLTIFYVNLLKLNRRRRYEE